MIKLDDEFLVSLGLGAMPAEERQDLLGTLLETLEINVGTRLSEGMSEEQLKEFEGLVDSKDEQGAMHWLETNRPNYKEVVAEEIEKIKKEIESNKHKLVG